MRKGIAVLVLLASASLAGDGTGADRQVAWVADWDRAFAQAKKEDRPVMLCINSKDGESANEKTAKTIYRDPAFVRLSRRFVMVVVSTRTHGTSGRCPRFGRVTCQDHLQCWKALRANFAEQFMASAMSGKMISPQHAWFRPDGTLLRRKEYFLSKADLLGRMHKVLAEVRREAEDEEQGSAAGGTDGDASGDGAGGPDGDGPIDVRKQPLTDAEKAELERVRTADREGRRAALANLLATGKLAAHAALLAFLEESKETGLRCDVLRALGRALVVEAREAIEACLKDRDDLVRSFAAVALEELRLPGSVPALVKRARRERDTQARKNMYRAAGACGGPAADKDAAKALLYALRSDRQNAVKKHAAYALHHFEGEKASRLVLRRLERAALRAHDYGVRGGIVYTLAIIGDEETTLPVLEKIREENENNRWTRRFMDAAIRRLAGEATGFGRTTRFLFREDRDDPARSD